MGFTFEQWLVLIGALTTSIISIIQSWRVNSKADTNEQNNATIAGMAAVIARLINDNPSMGDVPDEGVKSLKAVANDPGTPQPMPPCAEAELKK